MSENLLITPRLIIRKPNQNDLIPLNKAVNNTVELLRQWMPWAMDSSLQTTETFINSAVHAWESDNQTIFPMIVVTRDNNQLISCSGYNEKSDVTVPFFEIGYWLDVDYQGKGLMTEAVNALTRLAFVKYHAARVQIVADPLNTKSTAIAERCGFEKEAVLKKFRVNHLNGELRDEVIYACFNIKSLPQLALSYCF